MVGYWWLLRLCFCSCPQIFYFIGFACFCLESLLSIWVIQVLTNLTSTRNIVRVTVLFFFFILFSLRFSFLIPSAASIHVFPRQWQGCWDEAWCSKRDHDGSTMTWGTLNTEMLSGNGFSLIYPKSWFVDRFIRHRFSACFTLIYLLRCLLLHFKWWILNWLTHFIVVLLFLRDQIARALAKLHVFHTPSTFDLKN